MPTEIESDARDVRQTVPTLVVSKVVYRPRLLIDYLTIDEQPYVVVDQVRVRIYNRGSYGRWSVPNGGSTPAIVDHTAGHTRVIDKKVLVVTVATRNG